MLSEVELKRLVSDHFKKALDEVEESRLVGRNLLQPHSPTENTMLTR